MEREVVRRFEQLERRLAAVEKEVGVAPPRVQRAVPPSVQALKATPEPPTAPKAVPTPKAAPACPTADVAPPTDPSAPAFEAPPLLSRVPERPAHRESVATPPKPPARPPSPPSAETADWEGVVGVAVLGRIGVGAVLLAAGYFAQLAYRGMTDTAKVFALYGLSVLMLGAGAFVRQRVSRTYVGLLWGGGVAVSYMAGVAGHVIYDIFRPELAFVLLVLACVLGQLLARRLRSETLAVISLAGAFAVPFLVDLQTDVRTFLLAYALLLHGWAAFCERHFAWRTARVIGVLGLCVVGGTWVSRFGGADASTLIHLQGYVLGLLAPEMLQAWRRRTVDFERCLAAGMCVAVVPIAAALALVPLDEVFPYLFAPALLWLGLGVALSLRDRRDHGVGASLGMWSGFLLVVSGLFVVSAAPATWDVEAWTSRAPALVFSAMALLLLGLRPLLRAGEGAGTVAAAFGAYAALAGGRELGELLGLCATVLLALGALTRFGRHPATRADAHGLGVLLLLGLGARLAFDDLAWHPIAPALAALWSAVWLLRAENRSGRAFLFSSQVLWLAIGGMWWLQATEGPGSGGALWNAATISGLAIIAAAAFTAQRAKGSAREWFAGIGVVIGVLVGYREASLVPAALSAGTSGLYWVVGYFLAFAGGLAAASRNRWPVGRIWAAAVLALAAAHALYHRSEIEAVAVAGGVLGISWLLTRRDEIPRALAVLAGALAVLAWMASPAFFGGESPQPFVSASFLSAMPILGALAFAAFRSPIRARGPERAPFAVSLTAFAYLIGLHETLLIVENMGDAWPRIAVSLYSILFAASLLAVGFSRDLRGLRLLAIGMFFAIVAKIGLFDLALSKLPLRILVTGVLGLVLLAASYAYARSEVNRTPTA